MGYQKPKPVAGKTKVVSPFEEGTALARLIAKDDIGYADGAKRFIMPGKAALATRTTCNVFELLKRKGVPVAYHDRYDETSFLALWCAMIPLEVVVRGFATGSFRKRHPEVEEGHQFQPPLVEFFYKTSGRKFKGPTEHSKEYDIPKDDPLMRFFGNQNTVVLLHPQTGEQFMTYGSPEFVQLREQCAKIEPIALLAYKYLKKAWQDEHGKLIDVKFEFGVGPDGKILLADVVDCDSWRVVKNGKQLSKQVLRDGGSLKEVHAVYSEAARLTDHFVKH